MNALSKTMRSWTGARRALALAGLLAVAATTVAGALATSAAAVGPITGVDLSTYVRVARFDLPEPTRTTPPANSVLAQEASAVAYNWDTDTLFVVGDTSTSIVQVSKTGALIDSMTLAPGASPQGTEFYDTEGLAYIGGGQFVLTEERDRQVVRFTYAAGTTLTRSATQTVKLGTTVGNVGLEGITNDPATAGFIGVRELTPLGVFQTGIDFGAGTATNGSPTTVDSVNLFNPALAGVTDFADVFALSNLAPLSAQPDGANILLLSQEDGRIVEVSRSGVVQSTLNIASDPGNPLSLADQQHEGLTMDNDGNLYVVSENGGGDVQHPQLWVYAPTAATNAAPTAIALQNTISSIVENTSTASRVKVADIVVTDDGLGTNALGVTGPDAAFFEVDLSGLYLKAGTVLDFESKTSYAITVTVDDTSVGTTPDASVPFALTVVDIVNEGSTLSTVAVTEIAPWGSGTLTYTADWFEITNFGTAPLDITGWKVDDNSNSFASAAALSGVTTIAPGRSAIFLESSNPATTIAAFTSAWFGGTLPAGVSVGTYTGSGLGLSTGGDSVNVFDASGNRVTGVSFASATASVSFDNGAGAGSSSLPLPAVSTLSVAGRYGAFTAGGETGSPGSVGGIVVTEIAPWGSGSAYGADWFELTNTSARTVDLTGWKMDDSSNAFATAVALTGITTIAPGQSAILLESSTAAATIAAFRNAWYGGTAPAGVQFGTYSGSGVGLSTSADAVNVFDAAGNRVTGVAFGASTTNVSFDNGGALLGSSLLPLPTVTTLSVNGVRGAYVAGGATGSPGTLSNRAPVASAGPDQLVQAPSAAGATVTLAGGGSSDADGDALTLTWREGTTVIGTGAAPSVALGLGTHTLTVTAADAFTSSVDTVVVTVTVAAFTATPPAISTVQTAAFSWSALFFSRFECSLDGGPFAPCSSPRVYRGLAAGAHTLCVAATADVQPVCHSWTIVSPGQPVVSILSVSTAGRTATVSFTADQPATRFTCSLDGAAYRSCSSPLTYRGLALGSHTVRVLSTNFAGDTSAAPALATFTIG